MSISSLFLRLSFALALPVMLASCTGNTVGIKTTADAADGGGTEYGASSQQPVASAAMASTNPSDYQISPYDSLQVTVFQVQDLNKTVNVNADGSISLPLIGKVIVAGKTTQEAEGIIGDRLRKKYLQSPQVSVSVAKFGQRITVSGAVKGPKVLTVDGQLTLTQAIANAGGLSDLADSSRVHIARKAEGQRVQDQVFDLKAIQAGKADDPMLQGGDLVVAEESGFRVAFKEVKDILPFAMFANLF